MKGFNWLLMFLIAAFLITGTFFACGTSGDDDDTGTPPADDDTGADDDSAADDDTVVDDDTGTGDDDTSDDDSGAAGTISGTATDFKTDNPIPGAWVEAINDETGLSFDPQIKLQADQDGKVTLTGIPVTETSVGIKVSTSGYKDTYQFHFAVGATNEKFLGISQFLINVISGLLGITLDPNKISAAGAVYWGNEFDKNPVGCSEVTFAPPAPADSVHYFTHSELLGDLPTKDRDIGTPGDPQNGEGTNPLNGYFVAINVDPVAYTISANADSHISTSLLPTVPADSVAISDVYFDKGTYPTNPTGSWCTE